MNDDLIVLSVREYAGSLVRRVHHYVVGVASPRVLRVSS
jgi:hypothetical protein